MTESHCPHCHSASSSRLIKGSTNAALVMLLGLGVVGCRPDGDKDSSFSLFEPSAEPDYGVPDLDVDGDGFIADEQDCDDNDPNTFPGAASLDSETDCMKDSDGDDYGDSSPDNENVTPGTDCDDNDINIFPENGC